MKYLSLLLLLFCAQLSFSQGVQIVGPDTLCASGPCPGSSYNLRLPPNCTPIWRVTSALPNGVTVNPTASGVIISTSSAVVAPTRIVLCVSVECDSLRTHACKTIHIPGLNPALLPNWGPFTWTVSVNPNLRIQDISCYSKVRVPHLNTWKLFRVAYSNGQYTRLNPVLQTSNSPDTAEFLGLPADYYLVEQHVQARGGMNIIYSKIFASGGGLKTNLSSLETTNQDISIHPNPATEWLSISNVIEPTLIEVLSMDGRNLVSQRVNNSGDRIDISGLSPQVCIVRISTSTSTTSIRLLVE